MADIDENSQNALRRSLENGEVANIDKLTEEVKKLDDVLADDEALCAQSYVKSGL